MKFVVDAQGFKSSLNEFVFKEVAIVSLEEDALPSVFMFKPPYPLRHMMDKNKCSNRWLETNFHGISWNAGSIPYGELGSTMRTILEGAEVYVKGLEKTKWITKLLPNEKLVHNVEDIGCPALKTLPVPNVTCSNHGKSYLPVCAYKNALAISTWMLNQSEGGNDDDFEL